MCLLARCKIKCKSLIWGKMQQHKNLIKILHQLLRQYNNNPCELSAVSFLVALKWKANYLVTFVQTCEVLPRSHIAFRVCPFVYGPQGWCWCLTQPGDPERSTPSLAVGLSMYNMVSMNMIPLLYRECVACVQLMATKTIRGSFHVKSLDNTTHGYLSSYMS